MLFLRGSVAVSDFRLSQFPVKGISTEYLHIAETSRDLTPEELEKLEILLEYGENTPRPSGTPLKEGNNSQL
ncbi:MAG: hypothetical protein LBQ87_01910, partial [Candidatus Fibromonas sp.]|nr:hypothetical protein [Candidatus Fibromonas sp.]